MSNAAHTPGPWGLGDSDLHVSQMSVHFLHKDAKHSTICRMVDSKHGMHWTEVYANARLIAAAPDLLAALEKFVGHFDGNVGDHHIEHYAIPEARAAIAKAKGE